jgi:hypothetical protein
MKNFDDPNLDEEARELGPPARPRVEIVGDPARIADAFRKAAMSPGIEMNERIRESLAGLSSLTTIKSAREDAMKAAFESLQPIKLPKIDLTAHMLPRVESLKIDLPKRPRPVAPAHIAAVAAAVEAQTDAINMQTEALLALDCRIEALAGRSDNRTAWSLTFSFLVAAGAVVALFEVFLR